MRIVFKVLFRYALAILKIVEEKLLRQNDYMTLFSTFKSEVESLSDVKLLTKVRIIHIWKYIYRVLN